MRALFRTVDPSSVCACVRVCVCARARARAPVVCVVVMQLARRDVELEPQVQGIDPSMLPMHQRMLEADSMAADSMATDSGVTYQCHRFWGCIRSGNILREISHQQPAPNGMSAQSAIIAGTNSQVLSIVPIYSKCQCTGF